MEQKVYKGRDIERFPKEGPLISWQHIKVKDKLQYYDPLDIHFLVTSQHDKNSNIVQQKAFLWAQDLCSSKKW